jgi:hypothetical protein
VAAQTLTRQMKVSSQCCGVLTALPSGKFWSHSGDNRQKNVLARRVGWRLVRMQSTKGRMPSCNTAVCNHWLDCVALLVDVVVSVGLQQTVGSKHGLRPNIVCECLWCECTCAWACI